MFSSDPGSALIDLNLDQRRPWVCAEYFKINFILKIFSISNFVYIFDFYSVVVILRIFEILKIYLNLLLFF